MAIGNASLTLNILADDRVLKRVLADSKNQINTFSKDVQKTGKANEAALFGGALGRGGKVNQGLRGLASGTGLGSAALFGSGSFIGAAISAAAIKKSVDAASDLNEQITKSVQVFGESSKAIQDWSKDTAKNIGIGQSAALQAAGTFGNLFKAQGFGNAQNSQLSKNLVQLAADLASFNNIDPAQVLEDLNSAIVGEIEPVRKYGVDLRVARVQQEALAETGKDSIKQLTQQELSLARLHILYKDTAAAQGDFKRTQGGLANQERILNAQVQDLAASLGTLLLPAIDLLVTDLNVALGAANKLADGLGRIAAIKIPPIHIPFVPDFPGGSAGGFLKKFLTGAGLLFGPTALPVGIKVLHDALSKGVADVTNKATAPAAAQTAAVFSDFIDNVLTRASVQVHPKVDFGKLLQNVLASQPLKSIGESFADAVQKALDIAKGQVGKAITVQGFTNLLDSLQLGVEKAQVSGSLQKQLDTLEALKEGLEKQIKAGVDVSSAQHRLVAVEGQIASVQDQIKQDGIDKIIGGLQLAVSNAELHKGLADNLKALQNLAAGYRAQIKAGNDVQNNQEALNQTLQQISDTQDQIAQNAKDAQKARLFRQIGLSATGGEIIPGVANLKKQFEQLQKNLPDVQSTTLRKITNRFAGIGKVLASPFLKAQPELRSAIAGMFAAARDELNKQTSGPLTKTTSLNTNKVLKGLGLDPDEIKNLRSRLSKFNSGGIALAGGGVIQSAGGFVAPAGGGDTHITVELDGQKMEKSITVRQQKRSRRNPAQKRGPTVHNI